MENSFYIYSAICVAGVLTFLTRALPFVIWGGDKEIPKVVAYLGRVLPMAIMGTFIIYCIRNIDILNAPYGSGEILSVLLVAVLHIWKRNTFLSIGLGTVFYMFFIQVLI